VSVGTAVSEARARQLSRQMPDQQLVAWAVELARGMQDLKANNEVRSQVSRAADGAAQSPSVDLFTAWIRYQYARDASRLWKTKTNLEGKSLDVAHAVVAIVEKVKGHVTKAAQVEGSVDQALVERATMLAVARFLAFLRRAIIAEPQWRE